MDNLIQLLVKYDVPAEADLFSIDTDCYDFWLTELLLASNRFRPRVIVVEVRSYSDVVQIPKP